MKQFRPVADDHTLEFDPGQNTAVHFENDGEEEPRSYTAINRPGTDELILAIKHYDDGNCSAWMHERTRGEVVPEMVVETQELLENEGADSPATPGRRRFRPTRGS